MQGKILIIEDENELGDLVRIYLEKEGTDARLFPSAESGLEAFRQGGADLIVLDINLPGMDGFEFLQSIRRESAVPVVVVSARESDEDIVMGLGMGADEFVTKPFAPRVLMARIRAVLRRSRSPDSRTITFGPFAIDLDGYRLTKGGDRMTLSTKEFEVLGHLASHPGKAMRPEEIYASVWGTEYGDLSAVAVYIRRIRLKIEDDPSDPLYIQTVRGYGYRFNPAVSGIRE